MPVMETQRARLSSGLNTAATPADQYGLTAVPTSCAGKSPNALAEPMAELLSVLAGVGDTVMVVAVGTVRTWQMSGSVFAALPAPPMQIHWPW